ncbi:MAG: hypothetical protein DRH57_05125 [Candidatus Cloacimonadota bacterium]|nr:MAG: hypothetical protein DRH57_05125 [Candidatus Cloacimonadota bacterium]
MFYKELKPYLNRAKTVTKLNQLLEREKEQINLCGLNKSAKSLFVAHIFSQTRKDVILATLDDTDAENFRDDLHILLGENKVCHFPNYEVLPYEQRSPHFSRILPRIETLYKALYSKSNVYIISIQEFLRYINNPQNFSDLIYNLILGEEYNLTELISDLVNMGYKYKPSIEQVGDISKRGGIFDIFVPNNHYPFRIEFCGNIIESIRQFSVATQVSFKKDINEIQIQPMRELSIKNINKDIPSYFQDKIDDDLFYEGIEQDVPLLIKESVPFISYFDQKWTIAKRPILIFDEFSKLSVKIKQIKEEVVKHYENILKRKKRELIVPPEKLFADESFLDKIKAESHLIFLNRGYTKICEHTVYVPVKTQACFGGKIDILEDRISALLRENYQIFIQSDNKIQSKRLEEIVPSYDDRVRYNTGVFCNGFQFEEAKLAIFTDHEIFSRYRMSRRIYRFSPEQSLPDYESLKLNDYIVHIDYGIGIYRGLKVLKINGNEVEMIVIGYANNDKVYVPTNQLNLVTKFVANDGVVPEINRIGDSGWSRLKNKVRKNIEEIAQDLVELYAKRKVQKGYAFDKDTEWQKNLEASFIYQETPDQERVSQEIKNDMESLIPMDRLICGDVGFGKTELAVRAAFKAVLNGKQVAILVPTTVLAEQHFITFSERLADYPIVIDMLSRFKAKSRQNQIVENLKNGLIDIIIGTHRLLSNDIKFNELGLLIIDEEQRFGVNHKEKLKKKIY